MMQRDNPGMLILVALLGLSGLAVLTGDAPPPQEARDRTAKERAPVAAPATVGCGDDPVSVLCAHYGTDDASQARARFAAEDSRVVIATLPDPLDSEVGFGFDQRLETIRMAVVAAGFQPDRYYLPWRPGGKAESGAAGPSGDAVVTVAMAPARPDGVVELTRSPPAAPQPPRHRVVPGALLFRRPVPERGAPALLLVLLVGETPTFGATPAVVSTAIALAKDLMSPHRNRDHSGAPTLPVIGPAFSGGVEPWRRAVGDWLEEGEGQRCTEAPPGTRLRFVSGTATNTGELRRLACPRSDCEPEMCHDLGQPQRPGSTDVASYGASAAAVNEGLRRFFDMHAARWGRDVRVALLHEADTPYGNSFAPGATGDWTFLPYPLHVSQLWAAYLERGRHRDPIEQLDANARRSLTLLPEVPPSPIDLPPSLYPGTAANVAERMLSNLLLRVSGSDADFVGIVGSNVADVVFLTHLIRQQVPNAIVFTTSSHHLLTHPRHAEDLHGLWMVAPWYHDPRVQLPGGDDKAMIVHLPSAGDIGSFRATLDAVCSILPVASANDNAWCRERSGPRWSADGLFADKSILWLTAVGRGAIWPVDVLHADDSRTPPTGAPPAGFTSLMMGVSTLLFLVSFVYWTFALGRPLSWSVFGAVAWGGERHRAGHRAGYPLLVFLLVLAAAGLYPVCTWVGRATHVRADLAGALYLLVDPQRALITFCLTAVACAVITLCAATEAEIRPRSTRAAPTAKTSLGWILPVGMVLLGYAMAVLLCRQSDLSAFVDAQRAVHLTSGLSPVMPWLFLSSGLLVLAYAGMRRRYLLRVGDALQNVTRFRSATPEIEALVEGFRRAIDPPPPSLRHPRGLVTLRTGVVTLAGGATVLMLWRHGVVTMESPPFGIALGALIVVLVGGGAHLAARAFDVWQRIRRLLRALAWGPLADAFDRVPPELARTVGIRWSSEPAAASELRYDLDQLSALRALARREAEPDAALFPLPAIRDWKRCRQDAEDELAGIARAGRWLFTHETRTQGMLSDVAGQIMRIHLVPAWLSDERVLPDAGATILPDDEKPDVLTTLRRQPLATLRLAEEFVAVQIVRFVSYASAHLKNLLVSAIAVIVLTLLGVASYPFRPQQLIMRWLGTGFALTLLLTVTILVQVERNEVLSRIANRTPNRVGFDATFLMQIVTYVLLPVTAILVTQFPALSRPLSGLFGALAGG